MKPEYVTLHADDYGLSLQTSAQMLECCKKGLLDGISVLPNFAGLDRDAQLFLDAQPAFPKEVTCSVHLNLMEGPCLAKQPDVSLLTDQNGYLNRSWGSLFLASFLPGRKKLQKQLETEIAAQIKRITEALQLTGPLWIDGHQHTQMIPVVFDALCAVIERERYKIAYIRNSSEPVLPFLKQISLYKTYRPVNFVKNLILNFCALYAEPKMRRMGCQPMYLWGLVMSGHMDETRIRRILPDMLKVSKNRNRQLEILFHPGALQKDEITAEFSSPEALHFYLDEGRKVENAALCSNLFS